MLLPSLERLFDPRIFHRAYYYFIKSKNEIKTELSTFLSKKSIF